MQLGPLDRPTPRALAFAAGQTPRPAVVVEGEDQVLPGGPLDQVAVLHADANLISHQSTPALEQAARQLRPGGALMVTTGRGLMGDLDAFQERMDGLGFHTMGVVFQEKAYVVAEKDVLPGLGSVSPEQSRLLLARTQFAGQPDAHHEIEAAGLAPRFTTSIEGQRVHLSRPFRCRGYQATLGYVEGKDGSLKARLFYQSKSQGLWRSASGLMGQVLGKGPEGQFESSTTLPASLQKTLNGLTTAVPAVEGEQELAFHAPLEKLDTNGGGQFDHELTAVHFGHFASERPDSFVYARPELAPDFSKVRDQFTLDHPSRGQLQAYVVDSQDESARYLFLRDSDERAWLGSVEARSEVNSFMVPSQAYRLGALTHPAIEYVQQVPQEYRGETVVKEQVYNHFTREYEELPTYVDATSFVYQLPPVREFQAWQAARR